VNRILTRREQLDFAHKLSGLPLYYPASLDVLLVNWKAEKIRGDLRLIAFRPSRNIAAIARSLKEEGQWEGLEKHEGFESSEFDEWTEIERERRFTELLAKYNINAPASDSDHNTSDFTRDMLLGDLAKANSASKLLDALEPIVMEDLKNCKRKLYNIATFVAGRYVEELSQMLLSPS